MRRKIWIIYSAFAVLLWLVSLAKMLCYSQEFRAATGEAAKPLNLAFRLSETGFNMLFILFLLFLGWFLAYGFAKLRFVLPAALAVLLISALIEFAFTPQSRAPWIFGGLKVVNAFLWCGAVRLAFWAAKKHGEVLQKKKVEITVFSAVGILLALNGYVIQTASMKEITLFQELKTEIKMPPIPLLSYHLLYLFLLFLAGWYTAYGFLRLRIVFPVTLGILLIPALTEFAFHPLFGPLSIFDGVLFSAGWIGITGLYRYVFRKVSTPEHFCTPDEMS
ncbi:hypothetical protein EQM14_06785 [Caproiciproducens sp. NJN-50]|uniref:hypothetical protein n=1 Tax=Acutalibacteraceae TaxID=3082771 RepID=UPI000FFDFABF|nr:MULTISPECIES: hypothetical protein [Acutalibacteraceae]QAT49505.1 hypothetical protein EQM14_06785 [Caproiciproducens sp. NJN-50]